MYKEEDNWRGRCDARTLAEAAEIKADPERYAKAQQGAKEVIKEAEANYKGLKKVMGQNIKAATKRNKATVKTLYKPAGFNK